MLKCQKSSDVLANSSLFKLCDCKAVKLAQHAKLLYRIVAKIIEFSFKIFCRMREKEEDLQFGLKARGGGGAQ